MGKAFTATIRTFVQYEAPLERRWLKEPPSHTAAEKAMAALHRLDDDRQILRLLEIGLGPAVGM